MKPDGHPSNKVIRPDFGDRLILQPRIPISSSPLGCEIEEIPQRPDQVYVAAILPRLLGSEQQLRVIEMMNLAITPDEDVQ